MINNKPILNLILTETALELVPKHMHNIRAIQKQFGKYGKAGQLLDTNLHHHFMKDQPNANKRGRPDILQHFLLDSLGSPAVKFGNIKLYFSAASGVYSVSKEMRCPRDYLRFKGLMTQLLRKGNIPPKPPYLIEKIHSNFFDWIVEKKFNPEQIFKFSIKGEKTTFRNEIDKMISSNQEVLVLIGGFQKGHFSEKTNDIPGNTVSISNQGFDSWIIVQRLLALYEDKMGLI